MEDRTRIVRTPLVVLLGVATVAVAVYFSLRWLPSNSTSSRGQESPRHPTPNTVVDDRPDALRFREFAARMNTLEGRLRELERPDASTRAQAVSERRRWEPPSSEVAAEQRRQRIRAIEHEFSLEPVDEEWALKARAEMLDAFERSVPAGSTLADVECRSTFCRLVAKHKTPEAREEAEVVLTEVRMGGVLMHNDQAGGELQTVMFFVRKEYDSPDHVVRQNPGRLD